jgi:hypothetical protein
VVVAANASPELLQAVFREHLADPTAHVTIVGMLHCAPPSSRGVRMAVNRHGGRGYVDVARCTVRPHRHVRG